MQAMIASMLAQANTPPWFENQWLWELREDDDVGMKIFLTLKKNCKKMSNLWNLGSA